jgi:hypothetical protein
MIRLCSLLMFPPAHVRVEPCYFGVVLAAARFPPGGRPVPDGVDPDAAGAEHAHDDHQRADADGFLDQRLPQDGEVFVGHDASDP